MIAQLSQEGTLEMNACI